MVRLELSDVEANELGSVLEAERHRLLFEVSAADVREAKHDLKDRLDRLEAIQSRLAYVCSIESTDDEGWIPTG
jgi:hypothetical protein